ncbi:MAG: hypothetical protein Q7K43_00555 [Candidatus Woesearchaeota archaeon]|nr:hypothetical protein [Candidatus Woesearchaeota archaeon]
MPEYIRLGKELREPNIGRMGIEDEPLVYRIEGIGERSGFSGKFGKKPYSRVRGITLTGDITFYCYIEGREEMRIEKWVGPQRAVLNFSGAKMRLTEEEVIELFRRYQAITCSG